MITRTVPMTHWFWTVSTAAPPAQHTLTGCGCTVGWTLPAAAAQADEWRSPELPRRCWSSFFYFISVLLVWLSIHILRQKAREEKTETWVELGSQQSLSGLATTNERFVLLPNAHVSGKGIREQAAIMLRSCLWVANSRDQQKLRLLLRQNMYLGCEGTHFPSHSQTFSRLFYGLIAFFLLFSCFWVQYKSSYRLNW